MRTATTLSWVCAGLIGGPVEWKMSCNVSDVFNSFFYFLYVCLCVCLYVCLFLSSSSSLLFPGGGSTHTVDRTFKSKKYIYISLSLCLSLSLSICPVSYTHLRAHETG